MSKKKRKKNGGYKPTSTEKIVLATALLKLVSSLIDLVNKLIE